MIDFALNSRFGQHSGRLLEGCGRNKAVGAQTGAGYAQQDRLAGRRIAALGDDLVVFLVEADLIDLLTLEEVGVAGVDDADLLQHLLDDDLDMLVVDLYRLQAVDILNLVDEVFLNLVDALDPQDIMRVDRALGEAFTGDDAVALVHA